MAQRTVLVCDLHGDETPGTETVSFAVDGAGYEIDVCAAHASELRDAFSTYIAAGRRAGRGLTTLSGGRRRPGMRTNHGSDPAAVREWARANSVKVSERGRISAEVLEQYAAARK